MKKYIIIAKLLTVLHFISSTINAQDNFIGGSSSEYFNPKTDVYMGNYYRNAAESRSTPTTSPNYVNNYACVGRFKNSISKKEYYFSSEIISQLVGYFKSQGYYDLIKIVKSYQADNGSGIYRSYTDVEFKEINAQILKHIVILLSSFSKGTQYPSHMEAFFSTDMCAYGFIDVNGKFIIMPEYDNVGYFKEGLVRVEKNDIADVRKIGKLVGFLNESGKVVIPLIYGLGSSDFSEGLSSVTNKNGKHGYIDKKGKLVIPFQFDYAEDFKNGIAEVQKDMDKPSQKINKNGFVTSTKDNSKKSDFGASLLKGTSSSKSETSELAKAWAAYEMNRAMGEVLGETSQKKSSQTFKCSWCGKTSPESQAFIYFSDGKLKKETISVFIKKYYHQECATKAYLNQRR